MSITANMSGERELIAPLLFSGGDKLNLAVILHSLLKLRLPQTNLNLYWKKDERKKKKLLAKNLPKGTPFSSKVYR